MEVQSPPPVHGAALAFDWDVLMACDLLADVYLLGGLHIKWMGGIWVWAKYSDLTRPHPEWWFMWGMPPNHLISGW